MEGIEERPKRYSHFLKKADAKCYKDVGLTPCNVDLKIYVEEQDSRTKLRKEKIDVVLFSHLPFKTTIQAQMI